MSRNTFQVLTPHSLKEFYYWKKSIMHIEKFGLLWNSMLRIMDQPFWIFKNFSNFLLCLFSFLTSVAKRFTSRSRWDFFKLNSFCAVSVRQVMGLQNENVYELCKKNQRNKFSPRKFFDADSFFVFKLAFTRVLLLLKAFLMVTKVDEAFFCWSWPYVIFSTVSSWWRSKSTLIQSSITTIYFYNLFLTAGWNVLKRCRVNIVNIGSVEDGRITKAAYPIQTSPEPA